MKRYIKSAIQSISDADIYTKISVAADPDTPPEILKELSSDTNMIVRYLVSKNPNTADGTIEESFPLGEIEMDVVLSLAVDFWIYSDISTDELNKLISCVSDIIMSCGYKVISCEVVESDSEDEDYVENDIKYMTLIAEFEGCDDDNDVLARLVQDAVAHTFRDKGYEVSYMEYF